MTFLTNISYQSGYHLAQDKLHVLLNFLLSFCFLLCFWILIWYFNEIMLNFSRMRALRQILGYAIIGYLWTNSLNFFISQDLPCLLLLKFQNNRLFPLLLVDSLILLHFFVHLFHSIIVLIFYILEFPPFLKNHRIYSRKNYYIFCKFIIFFPILNYQLMVNF